MAHNWIGILQPQDTTKPAQPGGCSTCHTGNGNKPNPVDKLTQADFDSLDCLLCHGPNYSRTVVKDGAGFKLVPAAGVDATVVAQNAQEPTSEMCLRCHASTGGGLNAKHGVIPTKDTDVHMAKGMDCVDCHPTQQHKIAGASDIKVQELPDVQVDCSNCHSGHKGANAATLNRHAEDITCQTCHIPAIARDPKQPTVVERDWTKPVSLANGLFGPTNKMANNVMPEYLWWNRLMTTPPEPVGSRTDGKSKIAPWKRADYTIFADAQTDKVIYMKAGVYQTTGNPDSAVKKGAEDAKQQYSGEWKGLKETMVFSLNHQVAPASQALGCQDCHAETGRLDFAALGYSQAETSRLTSLLAPQPAAPVVQPVQLPRALPNTGAASLFSASAAGLAGLILAGAGLLARRRK